MHSNLQYKPPGDAENSSMEIADYADLPHWKILAGGGHEHTTNPFRGVFPFRHFPEFRTA